MGGLRRKYTPKPVSLREFHQKRNRVLIWHEKGGLGDVLMQRMLFEDFAKLMPDGEFIFACLPEYLDAASDHPYIAEVLDSRTIDSHDYVIHYNTCVTIADRYENKKAPYCLDHRSDIWAKYCGVTLTSHEMHFRLNPEILAKSKKRMDAMRKPGTPLVAFAPVSKMMSKTLLPHQIEAIVNATKDYSLVGIHKDEIRELSKHGIPGVYKASIVEWMACIASADYVISVDTAAFHLAGGMKKPLMGIFTFADGKAYGKYFDFVLVQKHRDNGDWDCGPCFKFGDCPKCQRQPKPCLTELSAKELTEGVNRMFEKWPPETVVEARLDMENR